MPQQGIYFVIFQITQIYSVGIYFDIFQITQINSVLIMFFEDIFIKPETMLFPLAFTYFIL